MDSVPQKRRGPLLWLAIWAGRWPPEATFLASLIATFGAMSWLITFRSAWTVVATALLSGCGITWSVSFVECLARLSRQRNNGQSPLDDLPPRPIWPTGAVDSKLHRRSLDGRKQYWACWLLVLLAGTMLLAISTMIIVYVHMDEGSREYSADEMGQ